MIFFLFGNDTYRSRQKLKEIKEQFLKTISSGSSAITLIDGQKTSLKEINEKSSASSLFTSKRLIVIENFLQNKNQSLISSSLNYFSKSLEKKSENVFIFFEDNEFKTSTLNKETKKFFNFLKKQKFVQEFKPLDNAQLLHFVIKEFNKYNKEIDITAANRLISSTSNNLWLVSNEIHKIAHYNKNKKISKIDIEENIAMKLEESIFILTDKLGQRQAVEGLKQLELQLASGLSAKYILAILRKHLQKLLQTKEALNSGLDVRGIASKFSWHPFATKKLGEQATNFSVNELKEKLAKLNNIDYLDKTGQKSIINSLELFFSNK